MAGESLQRWLSPNRRRICDIDAERRAKDPRLENNLMFAGWRLYTGPAQTDDKGWIIPGTDQIVDQIRRHVGDTSIRPD